MNLPEENKKNLNETLKKAVSNLAELEPKLVCLKSGVIYNREQDSYLLSFLNRRYLVHHRSGEVRGLSAEKEAPLQLRILLLHYLACADGTPLSGEWITFKELPESQVYIEMFQKRTLHPFLQYFGDNDRLFRKIAASLEAIPASLGNYSLQFRPFPKVPIIFVSWNDERDSVPSNKILFDSSAPHYLSTEDYALLPGLIIQEMAALVR